MPTIGELIRGARLDKDMTQAELAQGLGVSASVVSAFEEDEEVPGPDQISDIEDVLELPPGKILEDAGMIEGP
ncbi:MAG: helix-turn-helix domain-containing protein [Actinomycetota bacterium]|nr:helix-turn-helix domain-containing protein [Actinomycetota bacterium]